MDHLGPHLRQQFRGTPEQSWREWGAADGDGERMQEGTWDHCGTFSSPAMPPTLPALCRCPPDMDLAYRLWATVWLIVERIAAHFGEGVIAIDPAATFAGSPQWNEPGARMLSVLCAPTLMVGTGASAEFARAFYDQLREMVTAWFPQLCGTNPASAVHVTLEHAGVYSVWVSGHLTAVVCEGTDIFPSPPHGKHVAIVRAPAADGSGLREFHVRTHTLAWWTTSTWPILERTLVTRRLVFETEGRTTYAVPPVAISESSKLLLDTVRILVAKFWALSGEHQPVVGAPSVPSSAFMFPRRSTRGGPRGESMASCDEEDDTTLWGNGHGYPQQTLVASTSSVSARSGRCSTLEWSGTVTNSAGGAPSGTDWHSPTMWGEGTEGADVARVHGVNDGFRASPPTGTAATCRTSTTTHTAACGSCCNSSSGGSCCGSLDAAPGTPVPPFAVTTHVGTVFIVPREVPPTAPCVCGRKTVGSDAHEGTLDSPFSAMELTSGGGRGTSAASMATRLRQLGNNSSASKSTPTLLTACVSTTKGDCSPPVVVVPKSTSKEPRVVFRQQPTSTEAPLPSPPAVAIKAKPSPPQRHGRALANGLPKKHHGHSCAATTLDVSLLPTIEVVDPSRHLLFRRVSSSDASTQSTQEEAKEEEDGRRSARRSAGRFQLVRGGHAGIPGDLTPVKFRAVMKYGGASACLDALRASQAEKLEADRQVAKLVKEAAAASSRAETMVAEAELMQAEIRLLQGRLRASEDLLTSTSLASASVPPVGTESPGACEPSTTKSPSSAATSGGGENAHQQLAAISAAAHDTLLHVFGARPSASGGGRGKTVVGAAALRSAGRVEDVEDQKQPPRADGAKKGPSTTAKKSRGPAAGPAKKVQSQPPDDDMSCLEEEAIRRALDSMGSASIEFLGKPLSEELEIRMHNALHWMPFILLALDEDIHAKKNMWEVAIDMVHMSEGTVNALRANLAEIRDHASSAGVTFDGLYMACLPGATVGPWQYVLDQLCVFTTPPDLKATSTEKTAPLSDAEVEFGRVIHLSDITGCSTVVGSLIRHTHTRSITIFVGLFTSLAHKYFVQREKEMCGEIRVLDVVRNVPALFRCLRHLKRVFAAIGDTCASDKPIVLQGPIPAIPRVFAGVT